MKNLIIAFSILSVLFSSCKKENQESNTKIDSTEVKTNPPKLVTLSGAITETVAALGHGNEIVGKDVTSTYPADLTAKDLGHPGRNMTIEGVMAVDPTMIIAPENDTNPELLNKIKESGISLKLIQQAYSVEGAKSLIQQVAEILGNTDYKILTDKIDADLAKLQPLNQKPKILFIYARGAGNLMVAGKNTPMDALIKISGGENVITEFEDFKELTPESLINGNPDMILMFDSGLQSLGGMDGILKIPGVSQTNAGKNKKIITMDGGLMSSFGPRIGEAALELNKLMKENS